jgi:hypothetical protein
MERRGGRGGQYSTFEIERVCVEVVGNVKKLQITKAVAKQRDGWLCSGKGG